MKASVIGRVYNTELSPKRALYPLYEAVSNSIDAIAELETPSIPSIEIKANRKEQLIENTGPFESFEIIDYGVGFNNENFEAFNTVDTRHKSNLGAKGLGRFIWLKAFEKVEVESHFQEVDRIKCRSFAFTCEDGEIKSKLADSSESNPKTSVKLIDFKPKYADACSNDIKKIANSLANHFFLLFLEENCPKIMITDGDSSIQVNEIFDKNYTTQAKESEFEISDYKFNVKGFKLFNSNQKSHTIQYLANNRCVERENLAKQISGLGQKIHEEEQGDFFYLALVDGKLLDESVNNERTDFNLSKDDSDSSDNSSDSGVSDSLFQDEVTFPKIRKQAYQAVSEHLKTYLDEIKTSKKEIIHEFIANKAPQFRPLLRYNDEIAEKISNNPEPKEIESTLRDFSHEKRQEATKEGREILSGSTQDSEEYRAKFSNFLARYSDLCTTPLAEYVIHRKIILELFKKALHISADGTKYPLESAVHNIIFPMRNSSNEIEFDQQNLWLIDERLTYHSFLASDKPLQSIEQLESESKKRPDIIVFDHKLAYSDTKDTLTSVTIIEFKRPGNTTNNKKSPLRQVFDTINDINDGKLKDPNGRVLRTSRETTQFYVYVICELNEELEKEIDYVQGKSTPDRLGFFGYNEKQNAYYEVISYDKLLKDSQKRNRVLFDKLGIPADISS